MIPELVNSKLWKENQDGYYRVSFLGHRFCGCHAILHYDVMTHQQPNFQDAWYRKKLLLAIRAVMFEEHVDLVVGDFNGIEGLRKYELASATRPHSIVRTRLP